MAFNHLIHPIQLKFRNLFVQIDFALITNTNYTALHSITNATTPTKYATNNPTTDALSYAHPPANDPTILTQIQQVFKLYCFIINYI